MRVTENRIAVLTSVRLSPEGTPDEVQTNLVWWQESLISAWVGGA